MVERFDLIWIGTGQATMSIVPRILAAGKKVAVIESGNFGGTCVNTGCTPTKTLVAAARAIFQAGRGDSFGFSVDNLQVDFEKIMAPQKRNRANATSGIENYLSKHEHCTVFKGRAEFVDSKSVRVNGQTLKADHIVIHVGARPVEPNLPGIDAITWLNNEKLLDLDELPEHLAIVGGGYIGLEFSQIFRRFGSKVTIFERGSILLAREDTDVSEIAQDVLVSEGVDIIFESQIESVSSNDSLDTNKIRINYRQAGELKSLTVSHALFAIGRVPNSDSLNLPAAGVNINTCGFIEVNQHVQTNHHHIYAVGDVNGMGAFTHTSVNDGEIFWDHYSRLMGINDEIPELDRTLSLRDTTYSMFIDPPLARIGISEKEARQSNRSVLMATLPMSRISRAKEKQETKGIVKIFVDADTEEILGATVFGTGGDEIIGVFAPFMLSKTSYKVFRRAVFPHPTVGELLPWTLDELTLLTD
ncbi:mercuric reductase [Shewanella sp. D64]|uniref:mercuric reductase n=1 Tax=unclassified Shewanella TaxID=196818 RepID=UPI0022BA52B7|nr:MULTISPECIES: mercuric reductase [unclassified Shewanella]MEC4723996.1 mercuric reductase [Shewanella sp. D64]MEC4736016.1 mercuric reductase [Shewanella sp. E94]WBJ98049.1 mercuric reductase [Shewanella sp. MTB7]